MPLPTPTPKDEIAIAGDGLSATFSPLGAELRALRDGAGRDLLWEGDPAFWTGRAPILFPIVGALVGGEYRVDGRTYALPQHGFARRRSFALVDHDATSVRFRLVDDAESRAVYPFAFMLDLVGLIDGATLTITAELRNPGEAPLLASFGFHPAFRWPLPYGRARADHRFVFERPEPAPIRRIADGLLAPDPRPTPIAGDTLMLDDSLFVGDAIIMDAPASRSLRYGAADGPQLEIAWGDMPMLGLWSKPGAPFVCVEPWQGHVDPAGFAGDLRDKPGIVEIAPGATRSFAMSVTLIA